MKEVYKMEIGYIYNRLEVLYDELVHHDYEHANECYECLQLADNVAELMKTIAEKYWED